jgi:vacuolar protein sorting-associated protein IST1
LSSYANSTSWQQSGKTESARIRVENIIRSDLLTELHEILELYCELLLARIGLLDSLPLTTHASSAPTTAPLDPGLEEAVRCIIYAAPRTEIRELNQARQLLVDKFGKEFAAQAMENRGEVQIPERVTRKLRVEPPGKELVESYLKEIAMAYDIPYGDDDEEVAQPEDAEDDENDDNDEPGSGGQAELATTTPRPKKNKPVFEEPLTTQELSSMTPPRTLDPGLTSPVRIAPPSPSTDNANPRLRLPGSNGTVAAATAGNARKVSGRPVAGKASTGAAAGGAGGAAAGAKKPEGDIPDVNDLESRFKLLKK